jgi:hypothetical protein
MVTLDITDPLHAQVKKFTDNAFPNRRYENGFIADSNMVIVDWIRKDTSVLVDCAGNSYYPFYGCATCDFVATPGSMSQNKSSSPFGAGVGGSMARFALLNSYLYTVTESRLNVFDIATPADPLFVNVLNLGWNIETIYPFKERLFIGSSSAMFVFETSNPANPTQLATFAHVNTCDPVIAEDNYAYVTLHSGSICQEFSNELDVLNIENITNPKLLKTYQLTNPHGLSKDGSTLFICDDGVKIFNASNPLDIKLLKQIRNINAYDVIAFGNRALVVAEDGLYQFDYSNLEDIRLLSKISLQK